MVKIITVSEKVSPLPEVKKIAFKKSSGLKDWILKSFKDFASNTALHGYNHIVREGIATWERYAWGLVVIVATIISVILLKISWDYTIETPTVTVIESTHYPIWNVPFPAITICSLNKMSAKAALKLAGKMKRPPGVTVQQLSRMFRLVLHFQGVGNATQEEYDELHDILQVNRISVMNLTHTLVPPCTDLLERCMWKGTQLRCESLFQPINSTEGVCCSFNYYGLETNNFPTKIAGSMPNVPRRVTACGFQTGLTILVKPMIRDYHSTFFSSYGIRVFIHDPYDFLDENAETKAVSARMEAFISLSPESTYSTPDVRRLATKDRNCYFEDEVKLGVMQRYSYINCLAECRSEMIFRECGCVPYHLPNNGSYPVCQMNVIPCVLEQKAIFSGALPGLNTSVNLLSSDDNIKIPCNCLPDCQLQQYPAEITSANLNRSFAFNSLTFFKGVNLTDQSLINIFFADLVSTHYRKDIFQNWLAILASFGGLLGLLLGFSFVTGFEIFYFFTIRVFFNHLIEKRKQNRQMN